ncbi:hypothetical protein D3C79_964370 [compost metagenome]
MARKIPEAATIEPPTTTVFSFKWDTILSPSKRIVAIAIEKAAYPIPAISGLIPLFSSRKTALQSNIAPSDRKTEKHIKPKKMMLPFSQEIPFSLICSVSLENFLMSPFSV